MFWMISICIVYDNDYLNYLSWINELGEKFWIGYKVILVFFFRCICVLIREILVGLVFLFVLDVVVNFVSCILFRNWLMCLKIYGVYWYWVYLGDLLLFIFVCCCVFCVVC